MSTNQEMHVIFGTGPLGSSVMRELIQRGKTVRMVNRSGKANVPASVEVIAGNAYDSGTARRLTKGAAVVYQCAQPPYHQWAEKFPPLQASILDGAAANHARLVIGDNLYMYGAVEGKIHDGLPTRPHTRKGKIRQQMAEAALEAHQRGKVQAAIGRGSDFFGPGVFNSTMGERVFLPALQGKSASAVGSLDIPHTYTYIDDFGKALVMLGQHEESFGQVWHVPNPETVTQRQFITMIFDGIGARPKMSAMGKLMMSIGGLFIPEARESLEMMYEFERPFVVDDSKFRAAFGNHATPLRQAIDATVDWYRQNATNL